MAQPTRCSWAGPEPIYLDYHDHEWGRPTHDDRALFELLSLEGMQAGLSWIIILKKREAFRAAFADFEPAAVARFDEAKVAELMQNAGIVRNRRKIVSVIENARHFLEVQREFGSFDRFLWAYVDGKPIVNSVQAMVTTGAQALEYYDVPKAARLLGYSEQQVQMVFNQLGVTDSIRADALIERLIPLAKRFSMLVPKAAMEQLNQAETLLNTAMAGRETGSIML